MTPLFGRTFVPADEEHGSDAVLVLSNKYWRESHGGDPNIVGRVFQMNNSPHTVIGVLAADTAVSGRGRHLHADVAVSDSIVRPIHG